MKLLNYTTLRHLLFTALLLLLSIPVFYVVLNKIFIHAIDEDLFQQARDIPTHHHFIKSEQDLELWRSVDNDLEIISADGKMPRTQPFIEKRFNRDENEQQDYRILEKQIDILGKEYLVRIKSSMIEKEDLVQTILIIQLSLIFLLLLGAGIINYYINKRIWKPFYNNLAFLQSFKLEDPVADLKEKSTILEFRQLDRSIHQLAQSVHHAYLSQKEFTENASHELQTPLAILKSKVELLLQEPALSQRQSEMMDEMNTVIIQLEQLNKHLLFLSKMENNQFAVDEIIEINRVVNEATAQLQFMAEAKHQTIEILSLQKDIFLSGNEQLFKNMIKNLLRNAIQYSEKNTIIKIKIDAKSITIENPGMPLDISPNKLFKRFSKAGNQKGNGLGLAIAKKIAELHQVSLNYQFKEGRHSFQIDL